MSVYVERDCPPKPLESSYQVPVCWCRPQEGTVTDIVERLRDLSDSTLQTEEADAVTEAAADEIERLRGLAGDAYLAREQARAERDGLLSLLRECADYMHARTIWTDGKGPAYCECCDTRLDGVADHAEHCEYAGLMESIHQAVPDVR